MQNNFEFSAMTLVEQNLCRYFAGMGLDNLSKWMWYDSDHTEDGEAWGKTSEQMKIFAVYIRRHLTGLAPIPELLVTPPQVARPDSAKFAAFINAANPVGDHIVDLRANLEALEKAVVALLRAHSEMQ